MLDMTEKDEWLLWRLTEVGNLLRISWLCLTTGINELGPIQFKMAQLWQDLEY